MGVELDPNPAFASYAHPERLVSTTWLASHLGTPGLKVVESDEDVLPLARHINLLELLEDELIMAQPLVPRHEVCPTDVEALMHDERETPVPGAPAPAAAQSDVADAPESAGQKPHPFAALAALKKPPKA